MQASPLTDPVAFTRGLEAAYREMWITRCAAQPEAPAADAGVSGERP
jgi:hypothetical protein